MTVSLLVTKTHVKHQLQQCCVRMEQMLRRKLMHKKGIRNTMARCSRTA